ncbi:hypothetical protein LTR78_007678 [Recurvomyces mirabilis]|uniref:NADH dehydrogenase [ubiquinone] 1 beta subcomplex subunit 7 n=1 Tax=Recurvomyces mirabilis TaxID=574656 RepID=A0AAE0TR98_9PEZI|nr:hypothetical protein LTR78_007678 [Recurvomyces mirabilis]KAK5151565.1 hypothetical protein LTS14_009052 [Recurvomyces mirabilis]
MHTIWRGTYEGCRGGKKMLTVYLKAAATREQMSEARVPLAYRDACAHLLIPLNRCRYESYYLPWKCGDERHSYEKCQYDLFRERVKKMDEIREQKGGARSN